jgi:hypothetical protein
MPTGVEEGASIGLEVAERLLPKGIEWARAWWSGKRVLILGPARSGKTSFFKYLESDLLLPQADSKITSEVKEGKNITLVLGQKRRIKIRIWKPRDVPGQSAPDKQVLYVERYKPQCIVVILNATMFFLERGREAETSLEWLRMFCHELNLKLVQRDRLAARLQSLSVVMNKWDKIQFASDAEDKQLRGEFEQKVREILDEQLDNSFYRKGGPSVIDVIPCALVRSPYEGSLADEAVSRVASSLRE